MSTKPGEQPIGEAECVYVWSRLSHTLTSHPSLCCVFDLCWLLTNAKCVDTQILRPILGVSRSIQVTSSIDSTHTSIGIDIDDIYLIIYLFINGMKIHQPILLAGISIIL